MKLFTCIVGFNFYFIMHACMYAKLLLLEVYMYLKVMYNIVYVPILHYVMSFTILHIYVLVFALKNILKR